MEKNNLSQEAKSLLVNDNNGNNDNDEDIPIDKEKQVEKERERERERNCGDRLKLTDSIAGGRIKHVRKRSFVTSEGNVVMAVDEKNMVQSNVPKYQRPFGLPQPLMQTPLKNKNKPGDNDNNDDDDDDSNGVGVRIARALQNERPFLGAKHIGTPRPLFHPSKLSLQ